MTARTAASTPEDDEVRLAGSGEVLGYDILTANVCKVSFEWKEPSEDAMQSICQKAAVDIYFRRFHTGMDRQTFDPETVLETKNCRLHEQQSFEV